MTSTTSAPTKYRIESIDILRGLVMLIMAVDHVRDIFHLGQPEPTDLATTTPILFFTRFITHFCAPSFVFLSGVSAYIAGTRRTGQQLSGFLFKRGLWLIVVEVVIISFAGSLNPGYNTIALQVIWAIGGSMVLLALLLRLKASLPVIGAIGALIFFGHNIFDIIKVGPLGNTVAWNLFISAAGFNTIVPIGHNHYLIVAYALLPWTGVMLLGYVFGSLYTSTTNAAKRKKTLLLSGLLLLLLFLVLRAFNIYGDPSPWSVQKTTALSIISFFNITKYPCSLLYCSLTVGTAMVLLAAFENVKSKVTDVFIVYGNVPFFYYVCHWYLIQTIHVIAFFVMGFTSAQIVTPNSPFLFSPPTFGFSLVGVYIIWLMVIAILYLPCKWFSTYKKTHRQWWLSYI
ncbi:MAG: DUF1624 domain-containing protein [Mucilaginibacter sp.]